MAGLKKCPFCGGEVHIVPEQIDARTVSYQFICEECCCNTYFDYADREEAIEAWNNRVSEAEIRNKVIDEFARRIIELNNEFPTVENDYGEIRPMRIEEMCERIAEQMKGEKE